MHTYNPNIDYIYESLKDEFNRALPQELALDIGLSAKDVAWEVVSKLPKDEYDESLYVEQLLEQI